MSKKGKIKIVYKESPNTVVAHDNIFKCFNYEDLKTKIIHSNVKVKNKISEKDKFILEIEGEEIPGLSSIWNEETFNYFKGKIERDPPEKIKLNIVKVEKYPEWKKPQYTKILKKYLESAWASTKKEIEDDLTEKYLNDGQRQFKQEKKEKEAYLEEEEYYKIIHSNIVCNNCLTSNFSGTRYICAECDNFNLCEYCQENARVSHNSEHTFIKLNNPIFDDIQKYNSIFCPNKQLLRKNEEPFEIKINITNNGENNLQGCFFSPIRFGRNYLGCLKKTIINDCKYGNKISLDVLIKFEDEEDEDESPDVYEGYFRLMTKDGIPFGDIFNIKVIIEE